MNATARFEWPVRPDRIEVSSRGYLAAAILLCRPPNARTEAPPTATVHRLVPRRARPIPLPVDGLRRAAEA